MSRHLVSSLGFCFPFSGLQRGFDFLAKPVSLSQCLGHEFQMFLKEMLLRFFCAFVFVFRATSYMNQRSIHYCLATIERIKRLKGKKQRQKKNSFGHHIINR